MHLLSCKDNSFSVKKKKNQGIDQRVKITQSSTFFYYYLVTCTISVLSWILDMLKIENCGLHIKLFLENNMVSKDILYSMMMLKNKTLELK